MAIPSSATDALLDVALDGQTLAFLLLVYVVSTGLIFELFEKVFPPPRKLDGKHESSFDNYQSHDKEYLPEIEQVDDSELQNSESWSSEFNSDSYESDWRDELPRR